MSLTTDLLRLLKLVNHRRRWQLAGLLVLMLLGALAEMATLGAVVPFLALLADPGTASHYPVLQTIFSWFGGTSSNMLFAAAILFGVIAVAGGLLRTLLTWASLRISFGLGADIGGEVYRCTLHQPYSWHVAKNSSEILAGIEKVNAVVSGIISPLTQGVVALVLSMGILVMLLTIDLQTALIAGVAFSLLYSITTLSMRRQLMVNSKTIADNATQRVQAVQEGLGGIRDVLLDGTQAVYLRRYTQFDYALRRAQASNNLFGAAPRCVIESIGMVLIVGLAYWLAGKQGSLSGAIPVLGALAIGAQKLLPQMQLVYYSWSSVTGNRHNLHDVLDLLETADSPESHSRRNICDSTNFSTTSQVENLPGQAAPIIALRNVTFRYKPGTSCVLHDINLEIAKGSRIGFVGKTGSGKSTLIDLIMALLEPTSGLVEIDGQTLSASKRRAWQSRIAHVPQSIYLSDSTIAENIAFGIDASAIDHLRLEQAAKIAQIHDHIISLPMGYKTPVGERGVRLSGGQRQRLGIARAIYKQVDVLVLDEATSALDDETEKSVMTAIHALGRDLTILMIAHRVSTLQGCDQVVELGRGRILRTGSYQMVVGSTSNTQTQLEYHA